MNYVPYVIEQTANGERGMDIFSRLLKERIIILGSEIDASVANTITAQLLYLSSEDPKKDISLYINSPGGSISAGFAIYDTMQFIKCDVSTLCYGIAASMGAFLLMGGAAGKRFALPNAEVMIHQPLVSGLQGQATDVEIHARHLLNTKRRLYELEAKHTGKTYEEIYAASERDNYMSANEAMNFGLIDKVVASI